MLDACDRVDEGWWNDGWLPFSEFCVSAMDGSAVGKVVSDRVKCVYVAWVTVDYFKLHSKRHQSVVTRLSPNPPLLPLHLSTPLPHFKHE